MVQSLLAPLYAWGNNLLAWGAEHIDSYAIYSVDVWLKSLPTLLIAVVTFAGALRAGLARRTHLVQYDLPGRHGAGRPVALLALQAEVRSLEMQRLQTLRPQLQGFVHRPRGPHDRLQPLRGLHGLSGHCRQGAITYVAALETGGNPETGPEKALEIGPETGGRAGRESPLRRLLRLRRRPETRKIRPMHRAAVSFGVVGLMVGAAVHAQEKKVDGGLALIEKETRSESVRLRSYRPVPADCGSSSPTARRAASA